MEQDKQEELEYEKDLGGRPLMFGSVEKLEALINEYFESDEGHILLDKDTRIPAPTMSGLALYLGMDRKTLYNYSKKAQFFPTIKRAKARVEQHLEKRLYSNNVAGTIFSLKNNFDWSDKVEQVIQQNNTNYTIPDNTDPTEAARLYQDALKGE